VKLERVVPGVVRLWRWRQLPTPLWLRRLPGYAVGSLGAYWAMERMVAPVATATATATVAGG
jgi:hypothetical protein